MSLGRPDLALLYVHSDVQNWMHCGHSVKIYRIAIVVTTRSMWSFNEYYTTQHQRTTGQITIRLSVACAYATATIFPDVDRLK